jgi:hypothetical protein
MVTRLQGPLSRYIDIGEGLNVKHRESVEQMKTLSLSSALADSLVMIMVKHGTPVGHKSSEYAKSSSATSRPARSLPRKWRRGSENTQYNWLP